MLDWVKKELEILKSKIEETEKTAWAFLISFFKEAIKEEEAALFPAFKAQVHQIFEDEAKMAGLFNVKDRVALAVTEATAFLAQDLVIAKNALFHSWAWAIAHQKGLKDGNQGSLPGGSDTAPVA